jgi:hypothetical protein
MGQGMVPLLLLLLLKGQVLTSSSSSCRGLPGQWVPCAVAWL